MNRRDFLLFRTERTRRIVELSCRRLYLSSVEWRATAGQESADADADPTLVGEPPAVFESRTMRQIFQDLDRDLGSAQLLRVVDPSWLQSDELTRELDGLVTAHRARGGVVECVPERGT